MEHKYFFSSFFDELRIILNVEKRIKFTAGLFFIFFLNSNISSACDLTATGEITNVYSNGDGTYTIGINACIGDAGSHTGIGVDFLGALNVTGFSPASLSAANTGIGVITGGVLKYDYPSGTAPSNMFATGGTNPCFHFSIIVDAFPQGLTLRITNINSHYSGSCNLATAPDYLELTVPEIEYKCGETIYDEGHTGNYFNNSNNQYLICPQAITISNVTLSFTEFDLENGADFLEIYDENGTSGTPTIYTGTNSPGTITSTNPSGCFTMVFTSNGSITHSGFEIMTSCGNICGESFYDSGGVSAKYSNNENETYYFCADNVGDMVTLDFTSFNIENNYDFLYIYDEYGTSGTPTTYSGASPGTVIANNISGCLTVVFQSDASQTKAGWAANISCSANPLPVELVSFTTRIDELETVLEWSTASESNNKGFEIERSKDGSVWDKIGYVEGNGFSNNANTYSFRDQFPHLGNNYYRLKQIDFDGKYEYSNVENIFFEERSSTFSIFPNPSKSKLVNINIPFDKTAINIYNSNGQLIFQSEKEKGIHQLNIQEFQTGIYFVKFIQDQEIFTQRLVVTF